MLVQNKHLTTIWYEENTDKIKIIDQRFIPFELKIIELNTVDEVCFAIKEMQVRGAPLIGVTAAYGMYIAAREKADLKDASEKKFKEYADAEFRKGQEDRRKKNLLVDKEKEKLNKTVEKFPKKGLH